MIRRVLVLLGIIVSFITIGYSLDCSSLGLSGGTWITVPGNSALGTSDFCVMKYEVKNVSNVATSQAALTPWVSMNQSNARNNCTIFGNRYHLITNAEWVTIARNTESVGANWNTSVVGSGFMYSGHNDAGPASQLSISNINDPYDQTGDNQTTCDGFYSNGFVVADDVITGGACLGQKRVLILNNSEEIWDLSGNVWEWNNDTCSQGDPWYSGAAWIDWTNSSVNTNEKTLGGPLGNYNKTKGVGVYYGCTTAGNAFIRGGESTYGLSAGAYILYLGSTPASTNINRGFRCAYTPPITYISACTSITTPGDYILTQNISTTGTCITITTPNASLNCNGYTISGDGGVSNYGIYINNDAYDNNNISNCNINNFQYGIYNDYADNNKFINMTFNNTWNWAFLGVYPQNLYFENIIYDSNYHLDINFNMPPISFINVSDGNNRFIHHCLNQNITIDGWNNISTILLNNCDNSVIKNLDLTNNSKGGFFFFSRFSDSLSLDNISLNNYSNGFEFANENYHNISNINISPLMGVSSQYGFFLYSSSYSNLSNIYLNGGGYGFYLFDSKNNSLNEIEVSSYSNGIRMNDLAHNNLITNFMLINNSYGIYIAANSDNNTFSNGSSINNTIYNVYFDESGASKPENNTFYNNYLGNVSKIGSDNWTNINYFNYTLPGIGSIGNYWSDFGVCSSYEIRGIYAVCSNPANYTINSTNSIYDFAPLYNPYEIDSCSNLTIAGGNYYMNASILNSATSNCINISANNIIFDCRGFTIQGNGTSDIGILISRTSANNTNIIVRNCNVNNYKSTAFGSNINLNYANNNTFQNINVSYGYSGYYSSYSNNNTFDNMNLSHLSTFFGAYYMFTSNNNTLNNSYISNISSGSAYYIHGTNTNNRILNTKFINIANSFSVPSTTNCNVYLENITDENGKYYMIFNTSNNIIDGWTNISGLYLCGASNFTIKNLILNGNSSTKYGIPILSASSQNISLQNITISNYKYGVYLYSVLNSSINNILIYNTSQNGIYLTSNSDNNILTNFNTYNNSYGVWIETSNNNILSNFSSYLNSLYGLYLVSNANNNILSNFSTYSNSQYGIYLVFNANNNTLSNFSSYSNSQGGLLFGTNTNNNSIFNFNIYNNLRGILFNSNSINNTFLNGTVLNNTQYNLYFTGSGLTWPVNNTFYNNHLGNISKIYSNNWTNINYFNYTLAGVGSIGNYWNDFLACSSTQTLGSYKVCLNPANYTINSTNNIYDFAPLIVIPEYISPTPVNDTHFGGESFTIKVEDTQGVSAWFNVTINGVTYVMTNTSSTVFEYTFYSDYGDITEITYYVSYAGGGALETRVLTYYPTPTAFQKVPAFGLISYILALTLVIFGGFLG